MHYPYGHLNTNEIPVPKGSNWTIETCFSTRKSKEIIVVEGKTVSYTIFSLVGTCNVADKENTLFCCRIDKSVINDVQ